jgi:hypothetical protein
MGVDRGWVNDRVRGRATITADEVPALAKAIGVPMTHLLEDEPSESRAIQAGVSFGEDFITLLNERARHLPAHEQRAVELAAGIVDTLLAQAG